MFNVDALQGFEIEIDLFIKKFDIGKYKNGTCINVCKEVWKTKHAFVTIDLTSGIENGKYRKNLSTFYIPDKLITSSQGMS